LTLSCSLGSELIPATLDAGAHKSAEWRFPQMTQAAELSQHRIKRNYALLRPEIGRFKLVKCCFNASCDSAVRQAGQVVKR
jgi:hypothetical protein